MCRRELGDQIGYMMSRKLIHVWRRLMGGLCLCYPSDALMTVPMQGVFLVLEKWLE